MITPVNLGTLDQLDAPVADVLGAPMAHLAEFGDPAFRFGRLSLVGSADVTAAAATFLVLRRGGLRISGAGQEIGLAAGDVARIGQGSTTRLTAEGECELVVIAHLDAPLVQGIARLDLDAALSPSAPPSEMVLTSPAPTCSSAPMEAAGRLSFGLWSASPYSRVSVSMSYSEVMYFLEAAVTFTDGAGARHAFKGGDLILCPIGADLAWSSTADVRKLWITAEMEG